MNNDVLCSIGCDYITATAATKWGALRLHEEGSVLFRVQRDFGNDSKPWGQSGFSGFRCGSVQVGSRGGEVMVRLSSDSAARSWRKLAGLAENISRFDVQATVKIETDVDQRIDHCRRCAQRNADKFRGKRKVRWVREYHGGYTLYLGARQSNVFGRIYNKATESKLAQYESCLRYEAQFQNELALYVARSAESQGSPLECFAGYLRQFFSGRGIDPALPFKSDLTFCSHRPRSDDDKCLAWLADAVRPSVLKLIASGKGQEVFAALGLIDDGPTPSAAAETIR